MNTLNQVLNVTVVATILGVASYCVYDVRVEFPPQAVLGVALGVMLICWAIKEMTTCRSA